MSTSSPTAEYLQVLPDSGCGTLEAPWQGWENQLEADHAAAHVSTLIFPPGFYGLSRPVRLRSDAHIQCDPKQRGRAWFLPIAGSSLDTLFLLDGTRNVTFSGVCLNGRGTGAKHGVVARCGTDVQIESCRFGDFGDAAGAAILLSGESEERPVHRVVIQGCRFLNGSFGIRLERHTSDLLITGNGFEEMSGAATMVDPGDQWADYGLIFVENRMRALRTKTREAFVRILPGAEGIRLAQNTFVARSTSNGEAPLAAVEVSGGGPMSARRLEVLLNRIDGVTGPGIAASECGPGFLVAGNHLVDCGNDDIGSVRLVSCHGALVEDNEIVEPKGSGIHALDCTSTRLNGNEIVGSASSTLPRGGVAGLLVEGPRSRRMRLTDNRISCVRNEGVRVGSSQGVRIVGNEVQDCGEGIRVASATNLLLVGNDCRDNGERGIQVDREVRRGLVALNYAILNGSTDLEVLGERIRCHSNKVDRQGIVPTGGRDTPPGADSALDSRSEMV